jgi:hypothetical protein
MCWSSIWLCKTHIPLLYPGIEFRNVSRSAGCCHAARLTGSLDAELVDHGRQFDSARASPLRSRGRPRFRPYDSHSERCATDDARLVAKGEACVWPSSVAQILKER